MAIAGRSYANVPVIVRGSLEDPDDFIAKVTHVVTSQPSAPGTAVRQATILRSTLRDPPVLTTPAPVIVAPPPAMRWFSTSPARITAAGPAAVIPPAPVFPLAPLDVEVDILLGSTWAAITDYVYQRDGTSPPMDAGRGRPDETTEVNPSSLAAELNNRDGRFSVKNPAGEYYGLLSRNTPIRASVPAQHTYLRLEDDNSSACTCPTSSALNLSGDLDLRVDFRNSGFMVNVDGALVSLLASKAGASGEYSWVLELGNAGICTFYWSANGTALAQASSTVQIPLGRYTLRVTLQVSTGTVTFWTGPAGNAASSTNWTQLGSAVVNGATSIYASTADIAIGNTSSSALEAWGLTGSVYEMVLMSGIGGTVVAHPVFTSQAAAAASFTDSQGNLWTMYGTAELSGRSYRYHGEMSSLPVAWDVTGNDVRVPLESGGILRRLGQGAVPLYSPIKRALLAQSGDLALVAYWPCEDLQGATSIGSALGGPLMSVTGGTGDGSATTAGPAFAADSSFLCSNSLPTLNGSSWYGQVPRYASNGSLVVRFPMKLGSTTADAAVVRVITSGTVREFSFWDVSSTNLRLVGWNSAGSIVFDSGSVNFGPDLPGGAVSGTTLWVSMELQPGSGGTIDYSLVVLYPGATTAYAANGTYTGTIGNAQAVYVNPGGRFTDTVIGHISVQSAWESLFSLGGPLDAWQGELAGERFARLCYENNIPCRVYGAPDVTAAMGAQSIDTLSDLLQECEDADRGQIFEPRRSYGIGYRTQASMLQQAPVVTLDYSAAVLGQDDSTIIQPTYDDQYTRNDLIVQRASSQVSGASFQYQLNDGSAMSISPPPAGVGDYSSTESVNVEADTQLPDMASWLVHIGTVDEARWPALPVNLARSAVAGTELYWQCLEADIGDYIEVVNLPGQMPPDPVKQLLWDIKESFGGYWYQLTWTGVPESPYEVGVYDDLVYGRADTDGSTLNTAVSATAVTLSVATAAGYPLWTTRAADFPFDIAIAGERVTVTGITGSTSPQAFTVTRSVNGVSKAQSAGADVRLWFPPVYAML